MVETLNDKVEKALAKLDALVGLEDVKAEVQMFVKTLQVNALRKAAGLHTIELSKHWVFKGNPGTGKTAVAQIMADIYHGMGALEKGHFTKVCFADVASEYLGQTGVKMQEKIDDAIGGVLYLQDADEFAHSDAGREAMDALYRAFHEHYHDFAVILAGKEEEMEKFLLRNEWLPCRIVREVRFPD